MLANQKSFGWYIQAIGIFVISLALMAKVYSFASEGTWPNARQRMVVAVEFVLVAWSVWDLCSTWLRVAVSVFFSVSFAYNLTRLLSGETSCDCFGGFHFPLPLVVFISAAIAIASLIANVRSLNNVPSDAWLHKVRSFAFAEAVALSTIVVILAMSAFETSISKQSLRAHPEEVRLLNHYPDATSVSLRVSNNSEYAICILGVRRQCKCTTAADLPISIASDSSAVVRIQFAPNDEMQVGEGELRFITSNPDTPELIVPYSIAR